MKEILIKLKLPEFIEFIVKDTPSFQGVLRDGLKWLDTTSNENFGEIFVSCSEINQKSILDKVAFATGKKK